jgi:hypothetical protein
MEKLFAALTIFICCHAIAQDHVGPLQYNPRLYYSTSKVQHIQTGNRYKNFVIAEDSVLLVESDTLSLPFVDDFTYPTLKPYNYTGYIYDSVINAVGPCDTSFPVRLVTDSLSFNPTYTYTFDTAAQSVDSVENTPIMFFNTIGFTGDCYNMGDTAYLYPRSYIDVFDSLTGRLTYQIYDTNNVLVPITYAPVLYKSKAPAYTKWLDNNAYQNYTSAYLPPTIGVVTLDGLDANGLPYNKSSPANFGIADYLTSKPINLGGLTDADSVYLSFFYQPGGFGYDPQLGDSLVLQFYNGYTSKWDEIWSVTGDSITTVPPDTPDAFRQVILRLPSTSNSPPTEYLYNGFQLRFLNYGPLTGGVDIWNLDYVRLNVNRTFTDTSINDIAFQYQFPSILKNYSEMPAEQFTGIPDLVDTVAFYIDNLNPSQASGNPPATPFTTFANETYPATSIVMAPATNTFNAGLENTVYLFPSTQYTTPAVGSDSLLIIHSQSELNNPDILTANDTISHDQVLYNTLAYDDGTAELAYGLQNLGTNKFAYDYTLNQPDTLVGFQVLFANVSIDVTTLVFQYDLWYNLDTQNVYYIDSPVYTSNNFVPYYIDSVNGYTTYRIPPVPLPTHFYFGWTQTDVNNLQIGYDMNSTKGRPHMYIFVNGVWQLSQIPSNGSPMIRLLLGHSYQTASGVKDITPNLVKVYPNPTTGMLTFDLPDAGDTYTAQLYSILGQLDFNQTISNTNNTINISSLDQGMYMLRMTDNKTGMVYQNKIVKSRKE